MAKYSIVISCTAERLPEENPAPVFDPGADPIREMTEMLGKTLNAVPHGFAAQRPQMGLSVTKTITISVESLKALMAEIEKFDELAERVECEHPAQRW